MNPHFSETQSWAVADVTAKVDNTVDDGKSGGFAVPIPAAVVSMIPAVVSTAIDMIVTVGGEPIAAMVRLGKPAVREFVSEKSLEFIQSLVVELEDVKAQA